MKHLIVVTTVAVLLTLVLPLSTALAQEPSQNAQLTRGAPGGVPTTAKRITCLTNSRYLCFEVNAAVSMGPQRITCLTNDKYICFEVNKPAPIVQQRITCLTNDRYLCFVVSATAPSTLPATMDVTELNK